MKFLPVKMLSYVVLRVIGISMEKKACKDLLIKMLKIAVNFGAKAAKVTKHINNYIHQLHILQYSSTGI